MPDDGLEILVSGDKDFCEIPTGSPLTEALNKGGVSLDQRFSTNIWLYHNTGTQLRCNANRNSHALYWMALFPV